MLGEKLLDNKARRHWNQRDMLMKTLVSSALKASWIASPALAGGGGTLRWFLALPRV